MSKRIVTTMAVFGALLLQGCAVGATVTRPRLPTIVIGEAPAEPEPMPLPPPPPPPQARRPLPPPPPPPQPLSHGQAVAIGYQWCSANGFRCALESASFKSRQGIWRVELEAEGYRRGKGHAKKKGRGHWKHDDDMEFKLDIDAWSGALLRVGTRS